MSVDPPSTWQNIGINLQFWDIFTGFNMTFIWGDHFPTGTTGQAHAGDGLGVSFPW